MPEKMKSTKVQTLGADHAIVIHETLVNGQDSNNAQWDEKTVEKKVMHCRDSNQGPLTYEKVGKKKNKKCTTGTRTPATSDLGIWTAVL